MTTELTVQRIPSPDGCTLGFLTDPTGSLWLMTLEPATPIPAGRYLATWQPSTPNHPTGVYMYQDVPGHSAVELHIGNTLHDTTDCTLIGTHFGLLNGMTAVLDSGVALTRFETHLGAGHPDFYLTFTEPEKR